MMAAMRRRWWVLLLAALPALPGVTAAGEPVLDLEGLTGTEWYGIYVLERKVGYLSAATELTELDATPVLVETASGRLFMKIEDEGFVYRLRFRSAHEAVAPYRLVLVETRELSKRSMEHLRIEREGDEFVVTRLVHGRRTTKRVPASKETLYDATTVERFLASGPEPGDTVSCVSFDSDELKDVEQTARLVEIVEEEWRGERRRVFVVRMHRPDSTSTRRYLEDGTMIRGTLGGVMTLELEDEATARTMPDEGDLFELRRDIPVEGLDVKGEDVATLKLLITGLPESVLSELPTQRVEGRADGALVVTLTPGTLPAGASLSDEDRERLAEYLKATDEIQADHERIRKRARRIVRRRRDPLEQARAISRWVYRHVEGEEFSDYETALDVLIHLKGDCTEHTLLFVALCRAAGLPAREVSGLVYAGPAERVFGMHQWAQVYVGEWVDVDPALNQCPVDATHIALDTEDDGWFEVLGAFSDIRIEVLRAE